jgi:hypothetical protein
MLPVVTQDGAALVKVELGEMRAQRGEAVPEPFVQVFTVTQAVGQVVAVPLAVVHPVPRPGKPVAGAVPQLLVIFEQLIKTLETVPIIERVRVCNTEV